VFIKNYGWDLEQAKGYNTIISSISVVGLAVGSIISGKIVGKGRRNAILMFECFVLIAVLFTMVQSLFTLCLGRFMFGISGGVLSAVMSISMNETVPKELYGSFGAMTNFYILLGLLISAAFGGVLPTDPELWVQDDNWRIIYGMPAVIAMIQIAFLLVHFTEEPIAFSIGKGDDESA
jgi:MFS family permease